MVTLRDDGTSLFQYNGSVEKDMLQYAVTVYASGTAYALTATPGLITFGTTSPEIVINRPGTYLLIARLRVDYTGATFAAQQLITAKLRRTNNTAADVTGATTGFKTDIITTLTYTAGDILLPQVIYTTTFNDDNIELLGSIDVIPSVGTIDVTEAEVIALKIY